jgi:hypothetical protein
MQACILDPIPESLPQLLHYCIRREYFLMQRLRQGEAQKGAELSTLQGGAISVWFVNIVGIDASAALSVKQSRDRA